MKILVLNGSPHDLGNTNHMVEAFKQGAESNGHEVEVIRLKDLKIGYCEGCERCHQGIVAKCKQEDDMLEILDMIDRIDMLVFASPIVFYGLSPLMQTAISRFYTDLRLPVKKYALLVTSNREFVLEPVKMQYQEMVNFFEGQDLGIIHIHGDQNSEPSSFEKCKKFGASI